MGDPRQAAFGRAGQFGEPVGQAVHAGELEDPHAVPEPAARVLFDEPGGGQRLRYR
jgi:hypothetical protein